MVEFQFLQSFLIALALGALIGLEREYARFKKRGHDYAGIRTFPLIALFGAMSAYFGKIISPWILLIGIILMGILIIVAYILMLEKERIYHGATSEVAGFVTFFIGILCFYQEFTFAAFIAIIMTLILYARSVLHKFAEHIQKRELADTLKFAVIAFVILPFLPDTYYGPYGIFNPYVTWLMVVFVSAISFAGYIAMKWLSEKGLTLAGILGGLVSSTAVTTTFAHRSKKERGIYKVLALGVILANGVMLIKLLFIVFFLNQRLYIALLIPILFLIIITALFSYLLWKKTRDVHGSVHLDSPFTLWPAVKFAFVFSVMIALVKIADVYFSSKGVYLISFISGLMNIDPITISLSQLANDGLMVTTARNGLLIAALTNMGLKGGLAYWFGGKQFGKVILWFFGVLIVVGGLMIWLL